MICLFEEPQMDLMKRINSKEMLSLSSFEKRDAHHKILTFAAAIEAPGRKHYKLGFLQFKGLLQENSF